MSRTRMSTLPFFLLALYPLVIFDSNYTLISCALCKSNSLRNIFIIRRRNVEQINMTCHVQE